MSAALSTGLLEAAAAGDNDACEKLLEENAGLIWSVVRRYCGRGVDREDLYQLGCLGFVKAVRGFDTSYGTQFSTYAVPKIAGEIRRFLRDDGEPEEIAGAETAVLGVASLQEESGEEGFSLEDVLGTDAMEDRLLEKLALREAIAALPDREQQVIALRFYKGLTQDRCARVLGVSQVQISRLERRAVGRLRELLEG